MQKDIQSPEEFSRLYQERIELVRQAMLEAMGRVLAAVPVVDGLKTRSIMEVNAGKWYSGRIMLRACIADFLDALGEDLDGLIASANYLRGFIGYYACARVETAPVWRAINALGFLSDATDIQWRYMDANDRMRSCQWACDEAQAAIDIVTPQPALKGLIP